MASLLHLLQVAFLEISSKAVASVDISAYFKSVYRDDQLQLDRVFLRKLRLQPHADCCRGRRGRNQDLNCNCKSMGKSAGEMSRNHFQVAEVPAGVAAPYLPDYLVLTEILPRLPISSLFRFRCVSKQWKTYLQSVHFAESYSRCHDFGRPQLVQPFFTADGVDGEETKVVAAALYDSWQGKWIPKEIPWPDPPQYIEGREPVDSSEGLMCYIRNRGHISTPLVLIVVNPLTNCWRTLPPMLHPGFKICHNSTVVKIVPNPSDCHPSNSGSAGFAYKIIVTVREKGENLSSTEVYDSVSNSWKTTSYIPFPERINCRGKGPCIDGHFFCIFSDQTASFYMLMDYDVKQESWRRVRMGRSLFMSDIPSLLESEGRLLMVGGYGRGQSPRTQYLWQRRYSAGRDVPLVRVSRSARPSVGGGYPVCRYIPLERIRVWDIKFEVGDFPCCEMVAEIPKEMFNKLVYGNITDKDSMGDFQYRFEDMKDTRMPRCFAVVNRIFFVNCRTRVTVAYHTEEKLWTWVDECPKDLFPHAKQLYGAPVCYSPDLRATP